MPGRRSSATASWRAAKTGALLATPLFLALVMVEVTDLIFAVDSIPAIFAITADPFLVFTSNVFAILGLRSLYFALAGAIEPFRYLKVSLAVVLGVVGVKMLTHSWLKEMLGPDFNFYLLGLVLTILAAGVVASLLAAPTATGRKAGPGRPSPEGRGPSDPASRLLASPGRRLRLAAATGDHWISFTGSSTSSCTSTSTSRR